MMLDNVRIIITKSRRILELFDGETLFRPFPIALGSSPCGDKEFEGDGRTPEGEFYIFVKNPESKFHLSLGISYPNNAAAERGLNAGVISEDEHTQIAAACRARKSPPQKTALGGEIYIHGGGIDGDWTEGCIAIENAAIEELFAVVAVGTPVIIRT